MEQVQEGQWLTGKGAKIFILHISSSPQCQHGGLCPSEGISQKDEQFQFRISEQKSSSWGLCLMLPRKMKRLG